MTTAIFTRAFEAQPVFGISKSTLYRWARAEKEKGDDAAFTIKNRSNISCVRMADVVKYMDRLGD